MRHISSPSSYFDFKENWKLICSLSSHLLLLRFECDLFFAYDLAFIGLHINEALFPFVFKKRLFFLNCLQMSLVFLQEHKLKLLKGGAFFRNYTLKHYIAKKKVIKMFCRHCSKMFCRNYAPSFWFVLFSRKVGQF